MQIETAKASNQTPIALWSVYGSLRPGVDIQLVNASWDPDGGNITEYRWYIDGALVSSSSSFTFSKELAEGQNSRTFSIKLQVKDDENTWGTRISSLTISAANRTEYYLTDHLGSIRTTIDDQGNVLGYDDYDPFGNILAGRSSNAGTPNDLNKFTGVERDTDGNLNLDMFGRRLYDPEIGRFYGIDRFHFKYPSLNPFQYAANNPVYFIDINGDSLYVENRVNRSGFWGAVAGFFGFKRTDTYISRGGDWVNTKTGEKATSTTGFLGEVSKAVTDIKGTSAGSKLVSSIANGLKNVTIKEGSNNKFQGSIHNATITFNPSSGQSGLNTSGNTNRPAFIGLGHELAHSYDIFGYEGRLGVTQGDWGMAGSKMIGLSEMYASLVENIIRSQAGLPLRTHYGLNQANNTGLLPIPTVNPSWFNF